MPTLPQNPAAGLIWITGYSSAGKTTVGRRVDALLKQRGQNTVFLDGDQLRAIFGSHFGYQKDQRRELAKIYIRLCSHLSAQGYVVILSAIAMYDEVEQWMRTIVPRCMQVFLDVPREVRMQRDARGKGVYADPSSAEANYDAPRRADLTLVNGEGTEVDAVAGAIVEHYLEKVRANLDLGRRSHWDSYYSQRIVAEDPSPFATMVSEQLDGPRSILEVGCGNGRDAFGFACRGHTVTGIDPSRSAIDECLAKRDARPGLSIDFFCGAAPEYVAARARSHDVVYSRFVLHAMTLPEEVQTLAAAHASLKSGGRLFVECRSVNDPLAQKGEIISPTERIDGHYRRFIVREELIERVRQAGFEIVSCVEANGFAKVGDDDPVLIRMVAEKGH